LLVKGIKSYEEGEYSIAAKTLQDAVNAGISKKTDSAKATSIWLSSPAVPTILGNASMNSERPLKMILALHWIRPRPVIRSGGRFISKFETR